MNKETLRKVQLTQLEIAREVKRVCEENDITYWLDSGSMLGAVRHQGFIPWDDDLDLGMMRRDYEKFLLVAPKALDEKYELVDWKHVEDYPNHFCKIIKKGTVFVEEKVIGSSKCGIWIDVFPYDHCPNDEKARMRQQQKLIVYRAMIRAKSHWNSWNIQGKFYLKKWLKNAPFRLLSLFTTKAFLIQAYERCAMQYNDKPCGRLCTQSSAHYRGWVMNKECFTEFVELPFENDTFSCPADYDLCLRSVYGDYWKLPPEDQRENRHGIVRVEFGDMP